jgi:exodeoxyribonuclease-3
MSWKIATFNVNGVRARLTIILDWLRQQRPDLLCLQETKCQDKDFPFAAFQEAGYTACVRGQKAYNGVAVLSRKQPEGVLRELGMEELDDEARSIAVQVDGLWVLNTYVPQGREPDTPAFDYKLRFFRRLKEWLGGRMDLQKPLIWLGDLNVAPGERDVFDPARLDGHTGYHPAERQALAEVMSLGFVDLFRKHHPDARQFTFWDYRLPKSFQRNLGWRLDHILATDAAAGASLACDVDTAPRGLPKPSDHTPVWAQLELKRL